MHFFAVIFKGRLLHLRFGTNYCCIASGLWKAAFLFSFSLFLIERQSKTVAGLRVVVMVARQDP